MSGRESSVLNVGKFDYQVDIELSNVCNRHIGIDCNQMNNIRNIDLGGAGQFCKPNRNKRTAFAFKAIVAGEPYEDVT